MFRFQIGVNAFNPNLSRPSPDDLHSAERCRQIRDNFAEFAISHGRVIGLDHSQRLRPACASIAPHTLPRLPRLPQHVTPVDAIEQGMGTPLRGLLGRAHSLRSRRCTSPTGSPMGCGRPRLPPGTPVSIRTGLARAALAQLSGRNMRAIYDKVTL